MSDDIEARLAAARERAVKRAEQRDNEEKLLELQVLELKEKLEADGLGQDGKDFVVVATDEGPVALRLGAYVSYKAFVSSKTDANGNPTPAAIEAFVLPCVVAPDVETFKGWVQKRGGLAAVCAGALAELYTGNAQNRSKKS